MPTGIKLTAAEREAKRLRLRDELAKRRSDPAFRAAENARRSELKNGAALKRRGRKWDGGTGPLANRVRAELAASGESVAALMVLSANNDTYIKATNSGHREAQWFVDHLNLAAPSRAVIHLRGLHYLLVARGDVVFPSGMPYVNTPDSYMALSSLSKSARWLGYVPFERIIDNRNDEPVTVLPEQPKSDGYHGFDCPLHVPMPDFDLSGPPEITLSDVHVPQPYRIILIGEKSSLRDELEPLRAEVNAELILPTGELSDTLIYDMAGRAAADPRPSVVLYFSDFDPSGYNMPVSISRKLQALRDIKFPDLEIEVHAAALTLDQCLSLDLPSTPLPELDKRRDKWQAAFGREQTEIDALMALRPGELRRIAREAVKPFYDFTLSSRLASARSDWYGEAQSILENSDAYQAEVRLLEERQNEGKATIRETIGEINLAIDAAIEHIDDIGLEFEPFEPPEVEITAEAPRPLFDSREEWIEQTRRLKERKALAPDDDDT
jgi:hypothetical protein